MFVEIALATVVTAIALASAAAGVWLTTARHAGRALIPFGAGLLAGMALFGVLPELAEYFGWGAGAALIMTGFALLWFFDRYVHPICPSCSAGHDHGACAVTLHGFAFPLIGAALLHSLMDGLAIGAAHQEGPQGLGWGVFLAVAIHKVPEGLAYGTILRAALKSRVSALAWCAATQAPTVLGAALDSLVAGQAGAQWLIVPLALAGGSFLFLGAHAVHGEWRRRGAMPAFGPAVTGAAGAAALLQGMHLLLR